MYALLLSFNELKVDFSDAFPSNSYDLECIKNENHQAALYKVPP